MNGVRDRIVQRRRASASSRLGPPNGASPADPQPAPEPTPAPETRRASPSPMPQRATAEEPRGLRERSRIRRRARFLRRLRELQLRDIGGFLLELHRFGRDRPDLVGAKLDAAARTDRELRSTRACARRQESLDGRPRAGNRGRLRRVRHRSWERRPVLLVVRPGALTASPSPVAASCAGCGAALEADQEWCIECGTARTRLQRPPDWRAPAAVIAVVVGVFVIAAVVAILSL